MRLMWCIALAMLMSSCTVNYKKCKLDPTPEIKVETSEDGTETTTSKKGDVAEIGDATISVNPKAILSCPF